jgi:long-chain fatty acid transport protein
MRKLTTFLLFVLPVSFALGEGYQVNLQGNRQTGMAHTGTALNFGSSSIHFNPGTLSKLETKYDFQLGGSIIKVNNTFQKESPSVYQQSTDNPLGTPFYFYGAARLTDKLVVGFGVTTPYGNTLTWGDDWDGRFLIQDISFKSICFQPTASYSITDKLGFGAGFIIATGDVLLHKAIPASDAEGEGQAELKGNTVQYGYNIGLYYEPSSKISFGLDYRSEMMMKMKNGDATFDVPESLSANFPSPNTFNAELPLPANLVFGIAVKPNDKLTIAFDLQIVFWSAYDTLSFDFANNTSSLVDQKSPKNFENTIVPRIGVEYVVCSKFMARAGFAYDSTPVPTDYLSPETPGADKLNLTCGFTAKFTDKLSVDASFQYIKAMERKDGYKPSNFYGTYNTNAFIPGIGVRYSF